MDKIMQDYFETWKFKHPSPADFRNIFTENCDKNLDWYFKDGLNTIKNIDLEIDKKHNKYLLENKSEIQIPGYVEFYDNNNIPIDSIWVDGFENKLELISPENTFYAILDPENILFDIDPTNHTTRKRGISIPLFFDQPDFLISACWTNT